MPALTAAAFVLCASSCGLAATAAVVAHGAGQRAPAVAGTAASLGSAVAISGNIAVVGASGVNSGRGAAYVYQRTASGWHRQATMHDPYPAGSAGFGDAVAVSGTIILIGAPNANRVGAVSVYVLSGQRWRHQATLRNPVGSRVFGLKTALSGSTAFISAMNATSGAGVVYVFARAGSAWSLRATLTDPAGGAADSFGESLAIDGGIAVVGAPNTNHSRGAAYVYAHSRSGWHRQQAFSGTAGSELGGGTAVSAFTLLLGAVGEQKDGTVYVYARSGNSWHRQARLADPVKSAGSLFGVGVAVSGARLLVGKPYAGHSRCGAAYEFVRSGTRWRERAVIKNPRCTPAAYFAYFVALSGRTAIFGAPGTKNQAGAVYLLTLI